MTRLNSNHDRAGTILTRTPLRDLVPPNRLRSERAPRAGSCAPFSPWHVPCWFHQPKPPPLPSASDPSHPGA
jgi:hypothetical protein